MPPTTHVLDDLALYVPGSMASSKEGAPPALSRSWLQVEVRTWNAEMLSPESVLEPPPQALPAASEAAAAAAAAAAAGCGGSAEESIYGSGSPMVRRLLSELDEKQDIIRRCGVEVLELRKQFAQLTAHNGDLRAMLNREQSRAAAYGSESAYGEALDEEPESMGSLRERCRALWPRWVPC